MKKKQKNKKNPINKQKIIIIHPKLNFKNIIIK